MASHGIRDRVAIIGMGCTPFGEHWGKSTDDLLVDSTTAALTSAGLSFDDIDAYWLGTMGSGSSGLTLSRPLRLAYKPVTRLENMCATGSESLRNACYAVASGAYDVAMAVGVEKLKDSGFSGLVARPSPAPVTTAAATRPRRAISACWRRRTRSKYGVDQDELKDVLSRIAWKNHQNGHETRGRSSARRCPSRRSATPPPSPECSASSTVPAFRTVRPRRSWCAPKTRIATPTSRST